jgi:methionyl-tRNA formyltransferase
MINIIIITQKDNFFIPKNIEKIIKNNSEEVNLKEVCVILSKGALNSKKSHFFKGFGFRQSFKYAFLLILNTFNDIADKIFSFEFFNGTKSIKSICLKHNINYKELANPNSLEYINTLKSHDIDLVISFSAPVVFKDELLKTPRLGCINLHCSFLPKYSGLMPSFWALYNKEEHTGVSIHYMDTEIDNGKLLNQRSVILPRNISIFNLVGLTKNIGGDLMCDTIKQICEGKQIVKPNRQEKKYYYTWPKISQMKKFIKDGGRFV